MQNPADWNVIIVDDESDNIGVIELALDFHKAQSRVATSGEECLRLMSEAPANLLLIDIQMPGMDGFELLARIQAKEAWHNIPAIAITARVMPGDRQNILDAGFDGYIPKPIEVMKLVDEVKAILQEAKQRDYP